MPHQLKTARGSRFLCGCGCKTRKTNPRRKFAPGHDEVNARRNRMPEKGRPTAPPKKVPRVAWSPEKSKAYEAIIDTVGASKGTSTGFYFGVLVEGRGDRCFISARLARGLNVGDSVWVKLIPNDSAATPWQATECIS